MGATNFFSSEEVTLPVSITNTPRAIFVTIGDGSASIFEVEIPGVKFVTNTYAFDASNVQTSDYSVSSATELITFTFSSSVGEDSRSLVIEYVPDLSTSIVVTSSS